MLSNTRSYILGQIPIRVQKEIESPQPLQMNLKILLLLLSLYIAQFASGENKD